MHENKIHGTLMYYKTSPYINKIMNMDENKWNTYFIFTFIRNPYDRIVSGWNYVNKYNISFENYINLNYKDNSYNYWHIFMSQSRHIIGSNGKINAHFIGKLENIEHDLTIILNRIGYPNKLHNPFKKNSKQHDNYKKYYINNNVLNKVNFLMKEDFENFDYEKIDTIDKI